MRKDIKSQLTTGLFFLFILSAAVICWWLTVVMSVDFYQSSPLRRASWQDASWGMLFLMWGIMMAAMMLPSAIPLLHLFCRYCQKRQQSIFAPAIMMTLGYLLPWLAFSAGIAVLQEWATQANTLDSSTMAVNHPVLRAAFLFAASAYQFTPLKFACLRHCQHPAVFLIMYWRRGAKGAFLMGMRNGLYCTGCCWMLMLLLFVGGIMDLRWMVGLTFFALAEKILPLPPRVMASVTGVAIAGLGVAQLL